MADMITDNILKTDLSGIEKIDPNGLNNNFEKIFYILYHMTDPLTSIDIKHRADKIFNKVFPIKTINAALSVLYLHRGIKPYIRREQDLINKKSYLYKVLPPNKPPFTELLKYVNKEIIPESNDSNKVILKDTEVRKSNNKNIKYPTTVSNMILEILYENDDLMTKDEIEKIFSEKYVYKKDTFNSCFNALFYKNIIKSFMDKRDDKTKNKKKFCLYGILPEFKKIPIGIITKFNINYKKMDNIMPILHNNKYPELAEALVNNGYIERNILPDLFSNKKQKNKKTSKKKQTAPSKNNVAIIDITPNDNKKPVNKNHNANNKKDIQVDRKQTKQIENKKILNQLIEKALNILSKIESGNINIKITISID